MLVPARRRGVEILDDPATDPALRVRSIRDVVRSNVLLGGTRAVLAELAPLFPRLGKRATLLDVGTGLADIPRRAGERALAHGAILTTFGLDEAESLSRAAAGTLDGSLCGDARRLPFADASVDVVTCSQLLHHFPGTTGTALLREMDRVARVRVVVSDLRRSWPAAAGLWLASFPLLFHPISRHDGVVSVLRGFTPRELRSLVREAVGADVHVCRRLAFRVTTSWEPR